MPREIIGLIGLLSVLLLMGLRVPLALAFTVVGTIGVIVLKGFTAGVGMLGSTPFGQVNSYTMSVLPLFVLMGLLVAHTGLAERLFGAALKWCGRLPGGLAISTLVVTAFFSGICGSAIAAAATMAATCYPEMKKHNYDSALSAGVIAVGSTMVLMIPPSIPMVIFAMVADQSVARLFLAGLGPGILEVLLFSLCVILMVLLKPSLAPVPADTKASLAEKIKASKSVIPLLTIFLLVFGGMYMGVFTPTEAASVGVISTFVVCLLMRMMTWQSLKKSLFGTLRLSGKIFFLLIGVMFFNTFIGLSGLTQAIGRFIIEMNVSPIVFLAIVLLIYIPLGALMEEVSMVLLTLPLYLPIAKMLGIDITYFGVLIILAWQIGNVCQPVGLICIVTQAQLPELSLVTVYKGALPFIGVLVIIEALVLLFPDIAMFIPNTM